MIKFTGYVYRPNTIEDIFIIEYEMYDETGYYKTCDYNVQSKNILRSWKYIGDDDLDDWIDNHFSDKLAHEDRKNTLEEAQQQIMIALFEE